MRGVRKHSGKVRTTERRWVPSVARVFAVDIAGVLRGGVAWLRSTRHPSNASPLHVEGAPLQAVAIEPAACPGCPGRSVGPPVGGLRLRARGIDNVLKTRALLGWVVRGSA